MLSAKACIFFVRAENDLFSVLDDSVFVKACVAGGLFSAPTDCFDLFNRVCPREQPVASGKKVAFEVGAQSVADYRNAEIVNDVNQKFAFFL